MSSPNAEQDATVLSGEEQELSKEERLEAARKKFEELKKKKKKSKKKSKKGKEDKDEDVVENDDADSKEATNDTPTDGETKEVEDDELKKEDNKQDKEVASKEPEESEEKKLDTKKDENKAESDVKEDAKSELKNSDDVKVELKEGTKDELTAKDAEGSELKMESVKESGEYSKKDLAADKKTDGSNTHSNAEEVKEKAVDIGTEAPINDEKNENANDEKAEKIDLVASVAEGDEVTSLKATIEQQKSTIKKLRDENTDLKLSRMDLQDRIVELESQLKNSPQYTSTSEVTKDSPQKQQIKPAKPVFTQNDYASVSQQNFASFSHTDDFREKLMVWKGWQVDMRLWNATTNTQKISL